MFRMPRPTLASADPWERDGVPSALDGSRSTTPDPADSAASGRCRQRTLSPADAVRYVVLQKNFDHSARAQHGTLSGHSVASSASLAGGRSAGSRRHSDPDRISCRIL
jgi:hypothetical protein